MAEGVELLFGPILVGVFLNCILHGAMVVQTFIYFQTYKDDARWIKMFVLYLLFCETLDTLCDIAIVYEPLIIRYGTPRAVTVAPIMLSADSVLTVVVSTPVQLFIAWRVRIMSKSMIMPAIIIFFAVTSLVGGIATGVLARIFNKFAEFRIFAGAPTTWLVSSVIADILITVSLVYNLSRQRTEFAATNDLINRIIRLTVQTGLVTSVFAILNVTLFLASRNATLNFIFDLPLSKLYSNSLLSTLNARGGWRVAPSQSIQDNVLFGNGTDDESMAGRRTQMEIVSSYPQAGQLSYMVPVKAFDAGDGDHHEPAIDIAQRFVEAI